MRTWLHSLRCLTWHMYYSTKACVAARSQYVTRLVHAHGAFGAGPQRLVGLAPLRFFLFVSSSSSSSDTRPWCRGIEAVLCCVCPGPSHAALLALDACGSGWNATDLSGRSASEKDSLACSRLGTKSSTSKSRGVSFPPWDPSPLVPHAQMLESLPVRHRETLLFCHTQAGKPCAVILVPRH